MAVMHGKSEFSKIKGSICNIRIEAANICNILPRPTVSNGLVIVKLKRDLKYSGYIYFRPVCPHIICQVLAYLKLHNKFYQDISITNGLSSEDILRFCDINVDVQGENQCSWKSIIHGEGISDTDNERGYASVQDPLNLHRTVSNEATLISEIPNVISEENVIFAPEQRKLPVSILGDKFCEEQAFPYFLPTGKFVYNAPRDIPVSPVCYFSKWLLNFSQYFPSDADYIYILPGLCMSNITCSSIKFAMHKIKPGTLAARTVKNDLKGTVQRFAASDSAFSFMSSVRGTPAYWERFLYDVLAIVKQLRISTYFLTLSCADHMLNRDLVMRN